MPTIVRLLLWARFGVLGTFLLMVPAGHALSKVTGESLATNCQTAIGNLEDQTQTRALNPLYSSQAAACTAYMQAFLDGSELWKQVSRKRGLNQAPQICIPTRVTLEEIVRELPIWLLQHPGDRKENAWVVLTVMLHERYPCV